MRAALGASPLRLASAVALEVAVLSLGAGVLAFIGSRWADAIVRRMILTDVSRVPAPIDPRLLALTLAVTAATALLCGCGPRGAHRVPTLEEEGSRAARAPPPLHSRA